MARKMLARAKDKAQELMGLKPGTHYAFVGNPGTGKSTMLNVLTEGGNFASGNSYGSGKTKIMQNYTHKGINFYDTPGLADTKIAKKAGEEITKMLKNGGTFKIIFVVTLSAGRVRAEDRTTMELILDAAPITSYGVVFNKLTPQTYEDLKNNAKVVEGDDGTMIGAMDSVVMQLMAGVDRQSIYFHLIENSKELEDKKESELGTWSGNNKNDLEAFLNSVPCSEFSADDVKDVETNEERYQEKVKQMQDVLSKMKEDREFLMETMQDEKENFQRMIAERSQREEELRYAMTELEDQRALESEAKRQRSDGGDGWDTAAAIAGVVLPGIGQGVVKGLQSLFG